MSFNLYAAFEKKLEDGAKEFPIGEDAFITLMPAGGDKARRAFEQMMEPYAIRLNNGLKLTPEENKALNVRFYAETIVKGWRGLFDAGGKEIVYSSDACKQLLADPKLEPFFAMLIRISSDDASFEAAKTESDVGN